MSTTFPLSSSCAKKRSMSLSGPAEMINGKLRKPVKCGAGLAELSGGVCLAEPIKRAARVRVGTKLGPWIDFKRVKGVVVHGLVSLGARYVGADDRAEAWLHGRHKTGRPPQP